MSPSLSRRKFVGASAATLAAFRTGLLHASDLPADMPPLGEFRYADVCVTAPLAAAQLDNTHSVLMAMSVDSLLRPYRQMAGLPAPGANLGGWYAYAEKFNYRIPQKEGFAPGANFGQWLSALARHAAMTGDAASRARVLELTRAYTSAVSPQFYDRNRFPAYTYDKIVGGLTDAHQLLGDRSALHALDATTTAANPNLPGHVIERYHRWREGRDDSFTWDESYTLPENLYLAYKAGAGRRYRDMARAYLDDWAFFDPLAAGENVMHDRHAYSYVNALCSAMQAWFVDGSAKHLQAAKNGFDLLEAQSYATGGWGPDELLRKPSEMYESLTKSHKSFEACCGSYAHMKLTRALLRVTRDGRYGDSMERVLWNAALGSLPLKADGSSFYYADYNLNAQRVYSENIWPCCSGTLPQVATDYGISTYLQQPAALWVNLYWPSRVQWRQGGVHLALEQDGDYPFGEIITMRITATRPARFGLRLRIPAWCASPSLRINGQPVSVAATRGFAFIDRDWRNGDRIELRLPARLRLVPIDAQHPHVAALMQGPLVLFANTFPVAAETKPQGPTPLAATTVPALPRGRQPALTHGQALAATREGSTWTAQSKEGPLTFVTFPDLGDVPYTAYLKLEA